MEIIYGRQSDVYWKYKMKHRRVRGKYSRKKQWKNKFNNKKKRNDMKGSV